MFDIIKTAGFVTKNLVESLKWWTAKVPTHLQTIQKFYNDMLLQLQPYVDGKVECTAEELEQVKKLYAECQEGISWTQVRLMNVPRFYESAEAKEAFASGKRSLKEQIANSLPPKPAQPKAPAALTPIEQKALDAEEKQTLPAGSVSPDSAKANPIDIEKLTPEQIKTALEEDIHEKLQRLTAETKARGGDKPQPRKGIRSKGEAK